MSRTLTLLIVAIIAAFAFVMLRSFKNGSTESTSSNAASAVQLAEPNFHDWREFVSASGHFKVLFPSLPQHVSDKIADPQTREFRKYDTYISGDERGAAFMISAITFSRNVASEGSEEPLKAVVNDMLTRNKDNKLNEMKSGKFQNTSAIDFSITSGDLLIVGKVFARDHTVYVLSMINNSQFFNKKVMDFFFNSFDIKQDQNQKIQAPVSKEKKAA